MPATFVRSILRKVRVIKSISQLKIVAGVRGIPAVLNAEKRHFAALEGAVALRSPFAAKIAAEQPSKPVKLTATGVIYTGKLLSLCTRYLGYAYNYTVAFVCAFVRLQKRFQHVHPAMAL